MSKTKRRMHPFTKTTCITVIDWNEGHRKLTFKAIANLLGVDYNSFRYQLKKARESGLYDSARNDMEEYQKWSQEAPMRILNQVKIPEFH